MGGKRSRTKAPVGNLLLLGCSSRKRDIKGKLPALELYDGVNFRVLRKFLNSRGWPPGLCIKILSAKHGLIDAVKLIENYNQRLDIASARKKNKQTLQRLRKTGKFESVFVNLGQDYLPAIHGIDSLFGKERVVCPEGGIGRKMARMKRWLNCLFNKSATLPRLRSGRHYLYFFPDWDDFVMEPFIHETSQHSVTTREKRFAHEIYGRDQIPYDGMLVSLAQIYTGKGALSRLDAETVSQTDLRRAMKLPRNLLLFGDCGAFSYVSEEEPPFSAEEAARLYDRFGFEVGASVDHIPIPEIVVENDGNVVRRALTGDEQRQRMLVTARNARKFLKAWKRNNYKFVPIGVIQGIDTQSYARYAEQYIDMGYTHIALGGLVPKTDSEIVEICCAVREAIQNRTRTAKQNIWLHLFGILRPKIQSTFRLLGVSSFDSASYLRKAWLRSDQNYLAADGKRWYTAIRVPISTSKRLHESAAGKNITQDNLREMETRCLEALRNFDGSKNTHREVVNAVNDYGPLLERRGEDNHFIEKHETLLTDRPWRKCRCAVCRDMGIDVAVFRGTGRNKRRGFHNTWVLYHKILHRK
jgi:hypothetical protein